MNIQAKHWVLRWVVGSICTVRYVKILLKLKITVKIIQCKSTSSHLKPELNPSAQRCPTRFFTGDFASWTVHFFNTYALKTNKYTNYSFSLLIMYGSSYMFRHYIAILMERS
jgi:hypothetical protein